MACPLGQEAASIAVPNHSDGRGWASRCLSTSVDALADTITIGTAMATRTRRRTSATSTSSAPITRYGFGSARWAMASTKGASRGLLSSVKPSRVAASRKRATG